MRNVYGLVRPRFFLAGRTRAVQAALRLFSPPSLSGLQPVRQDSKTRPKRPVKTRHRHGHRHRHDTDTDTDRTPTRSQIPTRAPPEPICETVPRQTFEPSTGAPSGGAIARYRTSAAPHPPGSATWRTPPSISAQRALFQSHAETDRRRSAVLSDSAITVLMEATTACRRRIDADDLSIEAWFQPSPPTVAGSLQHRGGASTQNQRWKTPRTLPPERRQFMGRPRAHSPRPGQRRTVAPCGIHGGQRSDGYRACLWLDGESDCISKVDNRSPKDSNVRPAIGAEPNEDSGNTPIRAILWATSMPWWCMTLC